MRPFIAFSLFALYICTAAADGTNGGLRREDNQAQGERRVSSNTNPCYVFRCQFFA